LIGSIRRECLDHVIILNHRHLRRMLRAYLASYHRSRTAAMLAAPGVSGACSDVPRSKSDRVRVENARYRRRADRLLANHRVLRREIHVTKEISRQRGLVGVGCGRSIVVKSEISG